MKLVWKLLRQHLSVPQLAGFMLANLAGMFIVMLAFQFYRDVLPVFNGSDSFMKSDYLMVSKQAGTFASANASAFTADDVATLQAQPFVKTVGAFTSAAYKVRATIAVGDTPLMTTEMPIESVPDDFVGTPEPEWSWTAPSADVPIILPRSYITMYNFGYARSHQLPRISEGVASMIRIRLEAISPSATQVFTGHVVGFTSRLDAILVPQAFMEWSNAQMAAGTTQLPTRLLIDVSNPADPAITTFLDDHGLALETGNLDAGKTAYFLRLVVSLVMAVGLIISLLSFYILMLSIYLLVQKNASKLQSLMLIGYSPGQTARPYHLLTLALNATVLIIAAAALYVVRRYYLDIICAVYPDLDEGPMLPAIAVGIALMAVVSLLNYLAIRHKIIAIWKNKNS